MTPHRVIRLTALSAEEREALRRESRYDSITLLDAEAVVERIVAARVAEARAEGQSRLLEQYGYINAAEARAEADEAERDALRAAVAHVVRDHGMPPNKDQHGYDYRMGWWDAVLYLDKIITRGVGVCEDCPGRAALSATPTEEEA